MSCTPPLVSLYSSSCRSSLLQSVTGIYIGLFNDIRTQWDRRLPVVHQRTLILSWPEKKSASLNQCLHLLVCDFVICLFPSPILALFYNMSRNAEMVSIYFASLSTVINPIVFNVFLEGSFLAFSDVAMYAMVLSLWLTDEQRTSTAFSKATWDAFLAYLHL